MKQQYNITCQVTLGETGNEFSHHCADELPMRLNSWGHLWMTSAPVLVTSSTVVAPLWLAPKSTAFQFNTLPHVWMRHLIWQIAFHLQRRIMLWFTLKMRLINCWNIRRRLEKSTLPSSLQH